MDQHNSKDKGAFVYIIDRDGELDVFSDLDDVRRAAEVTGLPYVEQAVLYPGPATEEFLHALTEQVS